MKLNSKAEDGFSKSKCDLKIRDFNFKIYFFKCVYKYVRQKVGSGHT